MGCTWVVSARQRSPTAKPVETVLDEPEPARSEAGDLVHTVASWLDARCLPAPPWKPDPAWLEADIPDPPIGPGPLSRLAALVQTAEDVRTEMALDLKDAQQQARLARVIETLNNRLPALRAQERLEEDAAWQAVAARNDAADKVRAAILQRLFEPPPEPPPPLAPWLPLIRRIKLLSPLLALAQTTGLDLDQPDTPERLADIVRSLRAITMPALEDPGTVLRLLARSSAIARLKQSFGADPRDHPLARVRDAVQRKEDTVAHDLPPAVAGGAPLPDLPANPSLIVTPAVVALARRADPDVLAQVRWSVPPTAQLPLLTTAAPVAALTRALARLGPTPVRSSPCDVCDARAVMAQAAARASLGSGTGAVPAG